jgi:hypothetical protein
VNVDLRTNVSILSQFEKKIKLGGRKMAKNDKKSKIDEIVKGYFEIFEEDLGFSSLYNDIPNEEVNKTMQKNFKYWENL